MRTLHKLATQSAHREFFNVSGGTHNDTFEVAGIEYYRRLAAFIKDHVARAKTPAGGASSGSGSGASREVVPEEVRSGSVSPAGSTTDEEYLFVDKDSENVALPTMTTNFQVK